MRSAACSREGPRNIMHFDARLGQGLERRSDAMMDVVGIACEIASLSSSLVKIAT